MATGRRLIEYVLRGYGQLFLANRVASGVVFLIGLTIASPVHALLSLVGAVVVTTLGMFLRPQAENLRSGLFGVNGVLLGYVWVFFPEVPLVDKLFLTLLGAVAAALLLVLCLDWHERRNKRFMLFTLPYVLVTWLSLTLLTAEGTYDSHLLTGWTAWPRPTAGKLRPRFRTPDSPRRAARLIDSMAWRGRPFKRRIMRRPTSDSSKRSI